jgi:hypothetical protein
MAVTTFSGLVDHPFVPIIVGGFVRWPGNALVSE